MSAAATVINVAYYITGHGFGHVTRSLELIRGLLRSNRFRVHVVTNIPLSFFESELLEFDIDIRSSSSSSWSEFFRYWQRNLDTGGIQRDVIHMDPLRTLDAFYQQIHCQREALLAVEVAWLQAQDISLALLDATTLACRAGRQAGVKTVFVSNFSWDFIYQESLKDLHTLGLLENEDNYASMIATATEDMMECTHYIRYPGRVPLPPTFDVSKSSLGPLITRPLRNPHLRSEVTANLPTNTRVLLLGFGGHATDWRLRDDFLPTGWVCFVLRASPDMMPSARFRSLPQNVYVPDWIHAADVVLGKIGYGFVSECLNGGTPLVYVPRVYWSEEDYLVEYIRDKYHAALSISLEEFNCGHWAPYLESAVLRRGTWAIDEQEHPENATSRIIARLDQVLASDGLTH
jgi:L-arabinokinase